MVDARDLKSLAPFGASRFESGLRHQNQSIDTVDTGARSTSYPFPGEGGVPRRTEGVGTDSS